MIFSASFPKGIAKVHLIFNSANFLEIFSNIFFKPPIEYLCNMVSLWKIFRVFAKVGAFTIGGGYMMVPAIEAEMRRQKWISDEELPDIVAIAQSAPGLLTVNMSIFAGYKLRGVPGSIVATLGSIIAPFFVILLIAMFFSSFSESPVVQAIFHGVRPVAVAIIAGYCFKLLRRQNRWWQWAIALGTLAGIVLLKVSAVYILLIIIVFAAAIAALRERRNAR